MLSPENRKHVMDRLPGIREAMAEDDKINPLAAYTNGAAAGLADHLRIHFPDLSDEDLGLMMSQVGGALGRIYNNNASVGRVLSAADIILIATKAMLELMSLSDDSYGVSDE